MKEFLSWLIVTCFLFFIVLAIFCMGSVYERHSIQNEAVKRGFAVYEVSSDRQIIFKWKEEERDNEEQKRNIK